MIFKTCIFEATLVMGKAWFVSAAVALLCPWVLHGEGRSQGREMLEPSSLHRGNQREPVGSAGCQSEAQGDPPSPCAASCRPRGRAPGTGTGSWAECNSWQSRAAGR